MENVETNKKLKREDRVRVTDMYSVLYGYFATVKGFNDDQEESCDSTTDVCLHFDKQINYNGGLTNFPKIPTGHGRWMSIHDV